MYLNRKQAGYLLAEELEKQLVDFDLVLAIPRGGVVLAEIIARHFNKELDIILSRKIGSPGLLEPVLGAVAPDGQVLIQEQVRAIFPIEEGSIRQMAEGTREEIIRQTRKFRGNRSPVTLQGRQVLLVDDGIVTGSTVVASVEYLKRAGAASIIIATPVCSGSAFRLLSSRVNSMVVLEIPADLWALSQFYQDFTAVEDEEITSILHACPHKIVLPSS